MAIKLRFALPLLIAIISLGSIGTAQAAPVGPTEILEVNVDYELGRLTIKGTGLDDGTFDNDPIVTLGGYLLTNVVFKHLDPTIGPETIQGDIDLVSLFPETGDYLLIVDPNFKRAKTAERVLTIQGSSTARSSNNTGDIIGSVDICEFLGIDQVIVHIPGRSFVVRPAFGGSFEINFVPPGTYDIVIEAYDGEVISTLSGVIVNDKQQTDLGVVSVCIDADGDGFDATQDCNDANPDINPDAIEICNFIDDNCDNLIDEGLPTTEFWRDSDGDHWGDPTNTQMACGKSNGFVDPVLPGDCDDTSFHVNPSQLQYFTQQSSVGYDYDCNGVEEAKWTGVAFCNAVCEVDGSGIWVESEASCGTSAQWLTGCEFKITFCEEQTESRTQACK